MEGQDQSDELFPIAVLIDELKVSHGGGLSISTTYSFVGSMTMSF